MVLQALSISLETDWSFTPYKKFYKGRIKFEGEAGATELNLSHDISARLLAACSEAIVENSKAIANAITSECIDTSVKLIEGNVS